MVLTSLMTVSQVIRDVRHKALLEETDEWALFEVAADFNMGTLINRNSLISLERPVRDYEMVLDVFRTWDHRTTNVLMLRKYLYRDMLTVEANFIHILMR